MNEAIKRLTEMLKWSDRLGNDERLEIIEFFLMALEMSSKKFSIEGFFKELNRLTGCQ